MIIWPASFLALLGWTILAVALFRRWSLKRSLLDIPNERSSHSEPTPRGGGVVICFSSLAAFLVYYLATGETVPVYFFLAALIVAAISLADDLRNISPFYRILFHGAAALLVLYQFGGFRFLHVPFLGTVETGRWGALLAFLWIVWMINAFNFMDGIDGIAALQAITAGLGWAVFGFSNGGGEVGVLGAVLAVVSFGFLLFNWQPARIFMGDVGSAFLGFAFAVMPLFYNRTGTDADFSAKLPLYGVVFLWFFVIDSVYTFLRRLFRGERVWEAHRQHIYQKMVIGGMMHKTVTSIYGGFSLSLVLILIGAERLMLPFGVLWLALAAETLALLLIGIRMDRKNV
ncbi:MAG: glycosyltransferase family 4 protein [Acidobacteria bacterium]|nr:glycosyltransferase family 4 protein [Acidobacteriota bacterium]